MRSNSLDIQLKKREKELRQNEQEIADQQTLHDLTVKELELAKAAHKISQEECQQHKSRVSWTNLIFTWYHMTLSLRRSVITMRRK